MEVFELKREIINLILYELKVKCKLDEFNLKMYDELLKNREVAELSELLHKLRKGEI